MAKTTNGPSKSESIRNFLSEHPESKAKEVVKGLGAIGIKVSENHVYGVMGGLKEKKQRKARVVKAAKAAATQSNGSVNKVDAVTMIREVKALAAKAGGFEHLIELAKALAE